MKNEHGQVVLILILVMTVALAIGLSVIQRSLSDVSTSTKVEESSRAFSAAEAGIEKAISANSSIGQVDLGNSSLIAGVQKNDLPPAGQALEYPPLEKEYVAQVWLADPKSNLPDCDPGKICYSQDTLDVYWGGSPEVIPATDIAALELTLIYYTGGQYQSRKWYLENPTADSLRRTANKFDDSASCPAVGFPVGLNSYQCRYTINPLPQKPMLLRARLLYNGYPQRFAVKPTGSGSLPFQASVFASTGVSGETQRKVEVFKLDKVVPPYFDYAIFSASNISK